MLEKELGALEKDAPPPVPQALAIVELDGGRDLERICGDYGMDLVDIVRELRELGIDAQADWSLKKIAAENDMETKEVYDVVRQLQ